MKFKWEDGFVIKVEVQNKDVVLSANKEGLRSLANHLQALAEEPPGSHFHLDEYNSLEDGSNELIIAHIDTPESH